MAAPKFFFHSSLNKEEMENCKSVLQSVGGIVCEGGAEADAAVVSRRFAADRQKNLDIQLLVVLSFGRPVLHEGYVRACAKEARVLDFDEYVVQRFRRSKREGVFWGKNCALVLHPRNSFRKNIIEELLRNGGAHLVPHTPQSLRHETRDNISQLDYVFSEPDLLKTSTDFNVFMSRKQQDGCNVKVLSYFYIFRKFTDPEPEHDPFVYFRVENPEIAHLHQQRVNRAPPVKRRKLPHPPPLPPSPHQSDVSGIEVIDLVDSGSEIEDDDDEEVKYICRKRISRKRESFSGIEVIEISDDDNDIDELRESQRQHSEHIEIIDSGSDDERPGSIYDPKDVPTDDDDDVSEIRKKIRDVEVIPDLNDRQAVLKCLRQFSKQLSQSNSCIDIGDRRSKTVRYSRKDELKSKLSTKEPQTFNQTAIYNMVDLYNQEEDPTNLDYLMALDIIRTATSHLSYPPSSALKKIFHRCVLNVFPDDNAQDLLHAAHELFHHVLHLHPPNIKSSREYYREIFQNKRTEIFAELLANLRCDSLLKRLSSRVALEIMLETIQRDLEYYWKHPRSSTEDGLLVLILCQNNKAHKIDEDVKTYLNLMTEEEHLTNRFLRKIVTLLSLYAGWKDKKSHQGQLSVAGDSQKYKVGLLLSRNFYSRLNSKRPVDLLERLSLVRPSWLALSVAAHLQSGLEEKVFPVDGSGLKIMEILAVETADKLNALLKSFVVTKVFATFHYHALHWKLCCHQKLVGSNVIRFQHLSVPADEKKVQVEDSSDQVLSLDNKICFTPDHLLANLRAVSDIVQSLEKVTASQGLLLKMNCLSLK